MKASHATIQQLQSEVASLKLELVEAKATITKQGQVLQLVLHAEKKTYILYASVIVQQPSHPIQLSAHGRPIHSTRRKQGQPY